jgi:hypothetical protein
MIDTFIDYELLRSFDADSFKDKRPFPWSNLHGFLKTESFRALYSEFPPLELFEYHHNISRAHGQRPHNRHYLAYENSIYHKEDMAEGGGIVRHDELPVAWQRFMDELETSDEYHRFVRRAFDVPSFDARFAWHVGSQGSEVSPHLDTSRKLGTHILYFNTSDDWDAEWGGATLVLGGKQTQAMNPDFADFQTCDEACIVDNHSFLFKNTPDAWHGVTALTCPPGNYRRLFNLIFERPHNPGRRLLDRARNLLSPHRLSHHPS